MTFLKIENFQKKFSKNFQKFGNDRFVENAIFSQDPSNNTQQVFNQK